MICNDEDTDGITLDSDHCSQNRKTYIATTYSAQPGEAQTIFFTTILQNPDDV